MKIKITSYRFFFTNAIWNIWKLLIIRSSSSKTAAAEQERTLVKGYLFSVNQSVFLQNILKHETIIIPSSITSCFGSFHISNLHEKNIIINNLSLKQFIYSL